MSEIAAAITDTEMTWTPLASEIAREAGARLREFFAEGVATEYKGDVDLVTVADRTVETTPTTVRHAASAPIVAPRRRRWPSGF